MRVVFSLLFISLNIFISNAQWIQVNNGLGDTSVWVLSHSGSNLYAGTENNGIFVSTNNGANWSAINNGLVDIRIRCFAPFNNMLFAGTADGLYKSTNNGSSWTQLNLGIATHDKIEAIVTRGTSIVIGTSSQGVLFSNDDGLNWNYSNLPGRIPKLTVLGNTIFASNFSKTIYFTNNLSTNNWSSFNFPLPILQDNIFSIGVQDSIIYAGMFYGDVYRSLDTGLTWTLANNGLMLPTVIACFETTGTDIFLGTSATNTGVYLSSNFGGNWTKVNTGLINKNIDCLTSSNGFLFAGIYNKGIWRRPLSEMLIGINEAEHLKDFTITPNPANERIQITFDKPSNSSSSLSIYSIFGELVLKNKSHKLSNQYIDISNLKSGVYLLLFESEEARITKKFIKNKQ